MLALNEDGEDYLYGDSTDDSEARSEAAEEDDLGGDGGIEEANVGSSPHCIALVSLENSEQEEARQLNRRLSRMERNALEAMRGYVRQTGDIHFGSAFSSADHWDDANNQKWILMGHFDEEKRKHPEWVRPKLSIVVVKYGLKQLCDFYEPMHHSGDYSDVDTDLEQYYMYDDEDPIATAWDQYSCAADNFAYAADGYGDEEENGEANLNELQEY